MKQQAKKKKIFESLIHGVPKFPVPLAKVVSEMAHQEAFSPLPVVTDSSQVNHNSVMLFDGDMNGTPGPALQAAVTNYQNRCKQTVSSKFKQLCEYMEQEDRQASATSPVKVDVANASSTTVEGEGEPVPDLSVAMALVDGTMYENMEGTAAWLSVVRSHAERLASSAQPLPGFPALIQAVSLSYAPISFLLIPVQVLCDQGCTRLDNLLAFCSHTEGAEIIEKKALFVTLKGPQDLLWVPWGVAAVPIGREPYSDKTPRTAAYWSKTFFNVEQSMSISHGAWTSIKLCNITYLASKPASQKIWTKRKLVFDLFVADRAAHVLKFQEDDETQLDDPDDVITKDIAAALTAAGTARQPETDAGVKPPRPQATAKSKGRAKASVTSPGAAKGKLGIATAKGKAKAK